MFYALLDLLICPACRGELVLVFSEEEPRRTTMRMPPARRTSPAGAVVGPIPQITAQTPLAEMLAPKAAQPSTDGRDRNVEIISGLLVCPACGRWYPLREGLPELLPDHLRFWDEDREFLESRRKRAVEAELSQLIDILSSPSSSAPLPTEGPAASFDPGAHHKKAEMTVTRRPLPEGFFGPAAVAPFNPFAPIFSLDLVGRFAAAASLLRAPLNGFIFDLGCGYGWTTEWLVRLGYQAVGVDICRDYILAGRPRMGINLPHLIVGDVENIPLRSDWADAVLAFDAFHHIPGRKRALAELDRIMKPGTRVVMIEPGGGHEDHPRSIAVMKEHGILERGVDPDVLTNDLSGTNLGKITSHPTKDAGLVLLTMEKSGRFQTDSRAPRDLIADLKTVSLEEPIKIEERVAVVFDLVVENAGDTVWLHETPDGNGRIRLGVKLLAEDGSDIKSDYARLRLPRDLAPGQGLVLQILLPPISEFGRYIYEFDLVDEGFLWFKDYDYRPYRIPITIYKSDFPRKMKPALGSAPPGDFPAQALESSFYSFRWRMNEPIPNPQPSPTPIRPDTIRAVLREDGWVALVKKGFRRLRRAVRLKQP